jgi:hypothetical protein
MMTDKRERVEKALNFDMPDRVPFVDSFQHAGLIHYYTDKAGSASWQTLDVLKLAAKVADMVQGWGLGSSLSKGIRSTDRHGIVWETDEWYSNIVERPFKNADDYARALEKEIKRINISKPDYPETAQKMFLDDDLLMAPVKEFKSTFNRYLKLLDGTVLMYPDISPGLDHLYTLGGWEIFTEMYLDRLEVLIEYMQAMTSMHVERAHVIADTTLSPCVLIACDIAHKEGPLVSPKFMAEHYFPCVKRIVTAYHEHGMKVFYHSEGNLWPVLEELVATGIDGLNPCEPHSHMDVKDIRAKYPRLVLWGGVDNSFMLINDTPEDVRRRVEELKEFGKGGGLLIGSTGQIHPACKLENLIAMIETVHGKKIE